MESRTTLSYSRKPGSGFRMVQLLLSLEILYVLTGMMVLSLMMGMPITLDLLKRLISLKVLWILLRVT